MSIFTRIANALRTPPRPAAADTPGRNEPCWCGSGQKYKRCHLDADRRKAQARASTNCRTA